MHPAIGPSTLKISKLSSPKPSLLKPQPSRLNKTLTSSKLKTSSLVDHHNPKRLKKPESPRNSLAIKYLTVKPF